MIPDDAELLRRYARDGSEAAFTDLVRRHVDMVYSAALRRMGGDAHRAADVSQQVFTALARNAAKLCRHAALSAWLHTATRNAALDLMKAEQRRVSRETDAMILGTALPGGDAADWERIRPELDAAIDQLPESDRSAVVLRFLERKPFVEVGRALQVSEDAARMRTDRALDKLRVTLSQRGITSTAAALAAIVSSQSSSAAPVGLAATVSSYSLAAASTGGASLSTIPSIMSIKLLTTAGIGAILAFGLGIYFQRVSASSDSEAAQAESRQRSQAIATLQEANRKLKSDLDHMEAEVGRLAAANAELSARAALRVADARPASDILGWMPRYERQRTIMNSLRQIDAARDQAYLEGKAPTSVRELVGLEGYIKTIRPIGGEDYSTLSMEKGKPLSVTTTDGMTVTYDPSGATTTPIERPPEVERAEDLARDAQQLGQKLTPARVHAVESYRLANQGKDPAPQNPMALVPFFANPKDGADFVEWIEAQKAAVTAQKAAFGAQKEARR
jgi:RNA polymerase sigma factor (sigma-70 family)